MLIINIVTTQSNREKIHSYYANFIEKLKLKSFEHFHKNHHTLQLLLGITVKLRILDWTEYQSEPIVLIFLFFKKEVN